MNLELNWMAVAAGAAVVSLSVIGLAVIAARASLRARRIARKLELMDSEFRSLRDEVAAATGIGVRVGERLRRLDQVCSQMGDRLGQLELRGEGRPYDQAIALVKGGGDADGLVANFGLSRGEADLVTLLHTRRKAG